SPAGATFRARPSRQGQDFLVSPDTWFRPVFAAEGPEDALYVCDMYRKVIDHPQYLPETVRAHADFDAGKDKGRIYRIVPEKTSRQILAAARKPALNRLSSAELCEVLLRTNGWARATAFRLLLERKDNSTAAELKSMVCNSHAPAPTRGAALRLLDHMGALDLETLETTLGDSNSGMREQALQLAQSRLSQSGEVLTKVLKLADDPVPRVRFECALALGERITNGTMTHLAKMAMRDGADPWTRAAVLSSVGVRAEDFFNALITTPQGPPEALSAVMTDLSYIFGLSETPEKCL